MGWDREGVKKISGGGTADLGNQISAVGQDPAARSENRIGWDLWGSIFCG